MSRSIRRVQVAAIAAIRHLAMSSTLAIRRLRSAPHLRARAADSGPSIPYLPAEIVQLIVDECSLETSTAIVCTIGQRLPYSSKLSIVRKRHDVTRHLKELVDNPESLLVAMMHTKVILSGSRAVEYFAPGTSTAESDWDFFAPQWDFGVFGFMTYMQHIGVTWQSNSQESFSPTMLQPRDSAYEDSLEIIRGTMTRGGRVHRITVIVSKYAVLASQSIIRFHSSVVQCFIAGFGAVSLYPSCTAQMSSLRWGKLGTSGIIFNEYDQRAIDKYEARGVKYVSYESYRRNTPAGLRVAAPEYEPSSVKILRHFADSGSHVVRFDHCFKDERNLSRARSFLQALPSSRWIEQPYFLHLGLVDDARVRGAALAIDRLKQMNADLNDIAIPGVTGNDIAELYASSFPDRPEVACNRYLTRKGFWMLRGIDHLGEVRGC